MEKENKPIAGWSPRIRSWPEIVRACEAPPAGSGVTLTVIRHGQSTANAAGLVSGSSDPGLTAVGVEQAEELVGVLTNSYDLGFHSGLRRSRETLAAATRGKKIGRTFLDPRLAERSMGVLEGRPSEPLPAYDRGDLEWAPSGGEPYLSVTQRIASFLLDLQDETGRVGSKLAVLASTHVGPMRIAAGILERRADPIEVLTLQFSNAVPVKIEFEAMPWPPFLTEEAASG